MSWPGFQAGFSSSDLHVSLSDPLIGGINFLNEVMADYPDAISFAPGAPNSSLHHDLDIDESISRFLRYKEASSSNTGDAINLLHEYGPSRGIINELISESLSNDGVARVNPRDVVVTAGAQEAILLALRVIFRDSRDILIVPDPCYVGIVGAARLLDIAVVPVSEGANGLDLEQLLTVIQECARFGKRVRAVYVAPDFANPSGSLMSLSSRRKILEMANEQDFYLLEDSAYAFTQDDGEAVPALKTLDEHKRVILIGTFAKIIVPGVRVGFAVADQNVVGLNGEFPLASAMATIKSMVTVNTSPICQAIVGGLLLGSGMSMKRLALERGTFYRENLVRLLERLEYHCHPISAFGNPVTWNSPSGGFFVRVKLPVPADSELLRRSALEFGVVWTPMRQFSLTNAYDYEMRLSCSYLDRFSIDMGVQRLARLFATF